MTPLPQPEPEVPAREPVFNIAGIVVLMIAVCALAHLMRVYVLTAQQDFELLVRMAFIPARYSGAFNLDVYAFSSPVTYSFFHGDFVHLGINMIWLAAFGSPLANRIGAAQFAGFWAFSSVAAVALHYLSYVNDPTMVIGASGAVSGMMAAAARFGFAVDRRSRRAAFTGRRLALLSVFRHRNVVVFLTVWFVINLIAGLGYLSPGEARAIAWEAHIGGFLAGFFGIGLFDRKQPSPRV